MAVNTWVERFDHVHVQEIEKTEVHFELLVHSLEKYLVDLECCLEEMRDGHLQVDPAEEVLVLKTVGYAGTSPVVVLMHFCCPSSPN